MPEMVGKVVEGPIPEEEALNGGIKLVAFAGVIAVLHEQDMHPCMVNLRPGQTVAMRVESSDSVQIALVAGED